MNKNKMNEIKQQQQQQRVKFKPEEVTTDFQVKTRSAVNGITGETKLSKNRCKLIPHFCCFLVCNFQSNVTSYIQRK